MGNLRGDFVRSTKRRDDALCVARREVASEGAKIELSEARVICLDARLGAENS